LFGGVGSVAEGSLFQAFFCYNEYRMITLWGGGDHEKVGWILFHYSAPFAELRVRTQAVWSEDFETGLSSKLPIQRPVSM
jgi:hypothetical protein